MSSVVGATETELLQCISDIVSPGPRNRFAPADDTARDDQTASVLQSSAGTTIVYPEDFFYWDDLAAKISASLEKPTFSFHIHDGDLWMFILFVAGQPVARFNPIPEYWEELDPEEKTSWLPDAQEVADHVTGVSAERIAPYLREWPEEGVEGKANPEDEFEFIDWQVCDFMRELGLKFPDTDEGTTYLMKVKNIR